MLLAACLILIAALGAGLMPGARRHARPILAGRPLGFAIWAGAGLLSAAMIATLFSIGIFLLPLAGLAVYLAARLAGFGWEAFGSLAGAGGVLVAIGVQAWLVTPGSCRNGCGRALSEPLIGTGAGLLLAAVIAFAWMASRPGGWHQANGQP